MDAIERAPPPARGWEIDEAARAAVIAAYELDTLRNTADLKQITDFAAALCETPVALVSLVEETRQTFVSRTGVDIDETPREVSFCAHAMLDDDLMVIPDATRDPRFADNPLVTGDMHVRFYAGAPLIGDDGTPLGSLCVIDSEPRDGLTAVQRQGLTLLAANVMARFRDSRDGAAWRAAENHARRSLTDSEARFRTLADTMPQMVWSALPDGYHDYFNARWYEFTGMPIGSTDGEGWNGVFHPDDRDRAWGMWRESLATGDPYQIEYRLRHIDGAYRWVLGRALPVRDDEGRITRWFGTCTDIHQQKLIAEERELVSQELSHRIGNIFAVIVALIAFSAKARPEFAPVAADLRARIAALGRAHDFVRPHSARSLRSARPDSLRGLLDELFAPYQPASGGRIRVSGEDVLIDDRSATPLAMLFHELATNATKYGALSVDDGVVEVELLADGDAVTIRWREENGPSVEAPAGSDGFGTRLIELSAVRQLGGAVSRDWRRDGLVVTIEAPRAAFSRATAWPS